MSEEKSCLYKGAVFLQGQEVCEADDCIICMDGEWVEKEIT